MTVHNGTITHNSATLTIGNYSDIWYYQYTVPSGGQCSSPISGTMAGANNLSSDTSYTFTAYSDSGCTTSIASASFTTLALPTVANLSSSSLTVMGG